MITNEAHFIYNYEIVVLSLSVGYSKVEELEKHWLDSDEI